MPEAVENTQHMLPQLLVQNVRIPDYVECGPFQRAPISASGIWSNSPVLKILQLIITQM